LIEENNFLSLRIDLLNAQNGSNVSSEEQIEAAYLLKTLQGILMILPISNSFRTLKTRLECIQIAPFSLPLAHEKARYQQT
jgi:hypothetical protein